MIHDISPEQFDIVEISNEEYHSLKDIASASILKTIHKRGIWDYHATSNIPKEDSQALNFGTAYHTYVLEPDKFYDEIAVSPNVDKRTKKGKEEYANFLAEAEGKVVISQDEFDTIKLMYQVLDQWLDHNPEIRDTWVDAKPEVSFIGQIHDCKVRVRADKYNELTGTAFDLKTCRDATEYAFKYDSKKLGYDIQDIHYRLVASEMIFIAQQKTPPFTVNAYTHGSDSLMFAYDKWYDALTEFKNYIENGMEVEMSKGVIEL